MAAATTGIGATSTRSCRTDPTSRSIGNVGAFVNGNMFCGLFGAVLSSRALPRVSVARCCVALLPQHAALHGDSAPVRRPRGIYQRDAEGEKSDQNEDDCESDHFRTSGSARCRGRLTPTCLTLPPQVCDADARGPLRVCISVHAASDACAPARETWQAARSTQSRGAGRGDASLTAGAAAGEELVSVLDVRGDQRGRD